MKQKRLVSMIGVLAVMVSAVVLITGCPQANGNKDKKDNTTVNNGGNNGNNSGNGGNMGDHSGNNISINGVWKSTTPPPQNDLDQGLTDVYLAFDGQMHIYAYRVRGILYKGYSCAYTINGDSIILAGRGVYKFNINNNVLTIEQYMGNWVKINTPTLAEVQNAPNAND